LRPLIIWLGLTELVWLAFWLLSAETTSSQFKSVVYFWIVTMLVWPIIASVLGWRGIYLKHTKYFSNLIGFVSVLVFTGVVFMSAQPVRHGLIIAAKQIPDIQLVAIHVLRLLAIGTIIKYRQGKLPRHFFLLGSLTDFGFAASAVVVTIMVANGQLGHMFLIVWHLIGSIVFLGAGASMFFSMPSPFQITTQKPDSTIVFQFPMMLAPNFTVPLFVVAHALALVKLLSGYALM
jgi:hypothetical protein